MALSEFAIDVDEVGDGRLAINGEDVTDRIAAWQLTAGGGNVTTLALRPYPGAASVTGKGIVEVQLPATTESAPPDEAAVVCSFLDSVDPQKLETDVLLEFSALRPPATNGEAWLRVLRRYAGDGHA